MKQRCEAEAGEAFLATRENVQGLFLDLEDRALSYITGWSASEGINYSHPASSYLRIGLRFVEYDGASAAIQRFEALAKGESGTIRQFDTRTFSRRSVEKRSATIRLRYKRTTSDAEEKVGVFGRLVEVIDDTGGTVLARRRDFVWLNPDRKGAHGGYMCPTLKEAEHFPFTFLSKVLNVASYRCWSDFENGQRAMTDKFDIAARDALVARMVACEKDYFK